MRMLYISLIHSIASMNKVMITWSLDFERMYMLSTFGHSKTKVGAVSWNGGRVV